MNFTQRKFLSLSYILQHTHAANLLKEIYFSLVKNELQQIPLLTAKYQQFAEWMGLSTLANYSYEQISDRYHYHLNKAHITLQEHNLLPAIRTGDRTEPIENTLPIAIYLDNLRSSHNVGSIIRTVEAFALGEVFFSPKTPCHTHQKVQKTAMGTADWIKGEICTDLTQLTKPLLALETSDQAINLYNFIFPSTFTLILGNEEYGCSSELLEQADYLVQIPLFGRKNSLNVANAFAIVASEISRQLRRKNF